MCRFSLWLSEGTQSLLPSDRPHLRPFPFLIFLSEGAEMKGWYLELSASSVQETESDEHFLLGFGCQIKNNLVYKSVLREICWHMLGTLDENWLDKRSVL